MVLDYFIFINKPCDVFRPLFVFFILTPLLLGWVLVSSVPDWVDKINDADTNNKEWFTDSYYAENFDATGTKVGKVEEVKSDFIKISFENEKKVFDKQTDKVKIVNFKDFKDYKFDASKNQTTIVKVGDEIAPKTKIATGDFTNDTFHKFLGRMLLLSLFLFISIVVYLAYKKRVKEGRQ